MNLAPFGQEPFSIYILDWQTCFSQENGREQACLLLLGAEGLGALI